MAVGIFDSGLGSLTVLEAVSRRLPDVPFVYYGDNANESHGVRTHDDIYDLTRAAVERLWAEGCDPVIIACNTAFAVALKRMQETWLPPEKRVLGVFVQMIEALTERRWGDNSPPRDVEAQPCGGLVDAIEQGDEILAEALARSHVEALKRLMPNPQAAVLDCTHYTRSH